MRAKMELVGQVFGRLTVVAEAGRSSNQSCLWKCRCECGNETIVLSSNLRNKAVQSCGCLLREHRSSFGLSRRTHGERCNNSSEYNLWNGLKQKCNNPRDPGYARHGGAGVVIHDRWRHSFEQFLTDVGRRPSPEHVFGRIDHAKGYEPANIKWFTKEEATKVIFGGRFITVNGKSQHISAWSRETGIGRTTIKSRLDMGWTEEEAVTVPAGEPKLARKVPVNEISDVGS